MSYDLSPEEIRVLGSLIEKENATPDYYPLTLNGLLNACNQKTNREPVMALDAAAILAAIDRLRGRQLAVEVHGADSRVAKYEQRLDRRMELTIQETALLCVLMLRGTQTVGEMRARTGRIYAFEDMEEVQIALDSLLDREPPLIVRLPLQPGRKEARYAHLLAGDITLSQELATTHTVETVRQPAGGSMAEIEELSTEIDELSEALAAVRAELAELKREFHSFRAQFE